MAASKEVVRNLEEVMRLWQVLEMALTGTAICRTGWRNKFHLEREVFSGVPTLMRVSDDSSRIPWAVVTEDDMLADDWEIVGGGTGIEPKGGTYGFVLKAAVEQWAKWQLPTWHPTMFISLQTIDRFGQVMVMYLSDSQRKIFRPAPQDLAATNWRVVE